MSLLRKHVTPLVSGVITSPFTRDFRRRLAETRRRLRGEPHRIHYFHQVDDPYSHLAAQALGRFVVAYDVKVVPHLVGSPSDAAAPERERLVAYSRKDAADISPYYGLDFTDPGRQPRNDLVELAGRVLAGALGSDSFPALAEQVATALWAEDDAGLEASARETAAARGDELARARAEGERLRDRLGHYLGATFFYGGEWYWGIDRLHYLETRLAALGAQREGAAAPPLPRPKVPADRRLPEQERRLRLEFFASLRSPYTYISMPRVFDLPNRYPLDLVLRPVLPMVMRGLPVPWPKRLYILLDAKREAEQTGMPFGRVADPVGRPIERGFSLFPWARGKGKGRSICSRSRRPPSPTGSIPAARAVCGRSSSASGSPGTKLVLFSTVRVGAPSSRRTARRCSKWGFGAFRAFGSPNPPANRTSAHGDRIDFGSSK